MLAGAFAEVVTLGAVIPFIGVLMAPEKVFAYPIVAAASQRLGITSPDQLALPVTLAFVSAALVAGSIRMLSLWANTRLVYATGSDLGMEVYRRSLYQSYQVHTSRHTSEIMSGVTRNVDAVVVGILLPSLTLIGSITLVVVIVTALFAIDPFVASVAMFGFGILYLATNLTWRRRVELNGIRIATEQSKIFKALQEGLSGIRDVILDGTEEHYVRVYRQADLPLRRAAGMNAFIAQSPRFAMEAIGIALIALLAFALSRQSEGITAALPILGALALGAQRLLPALQQAYGAWTSLTGSRALLADTITLLDQPLPEWANKPAPKPLDFSREIRFSNVRFRYGENLPWVLDGLSFAIPRGARVGVVGGTGSGKSTAMDILMGLLTPTEGELLVDGVLVESRNVRSWRSNIAHVPQHIYLADASFTENIALGEPTDAIDKERVRHAAKQAHIADFIESKPGGYDNFVGENGIQLSGGQRQRVGIARALYKRARILVFDEATSALDTTTEQSIMDAIKELDRDLTILIVAHRLTTLSLCDRILSLEHGRIAAQGTYDDMLGANSSFRVSRAQ
jgi:ATP-binding cassette subfamily B protein